MKDKIRNKVWVKVRWQEVNDHVWLKVRDMVYFEIKNIIDHVNDQVWMLIDDLDIADI